MQVWEACCSMDLKFFRRAIEELLTRSQGNVNANALYDIYIEFVKEFVKAIDKRFKDVQRWDIEVLDEAVDAISDKLGKSAKVYEIWDEIWDAKIEKRVVKVEIIKAFLNIIDLAERKYGGKETNK